MKSIKLTNISIYSLDLSGDRVSFVENVNIVYDGSDTDESCNELVTWLLILSVNMSNNIFWSDAEVLEQNPDELFDRVENKTLSNFPKESGAAVSQKVKVYSESIYSFSKYNAFFQK